MTLFDQLWKLVEREAQKRDAAPDYVFAPIGLNLDQVKKFTNAGYYCTPINSTTFASTGGDGVHYGIVHMDDKPLDESPVVMTVPMMFDKTNVIVGENLLEFLCLGCEVGYFVLEQIAYDFWGKTVVDWIREHQNGLDDEEQELLKVLRDEFNLTPWMNVEARLDELEKQYLPLLQLKEDN